MVTKDNKEGQLKALHRRRILAIDEEATRMAQALLQVANSCKMVLENGGQLTVDRQSAFITGGYARLMKDLGALSSLQEAGARQAKRMK